LMAEDMNMILKIIAQITAIPLKNLLIGFMEIPYKKVEHCELLLYATSS